MSGGRERHRVEMQIVNAVLLGGNVVCGVRVLHHGSRSRGAQHRCSYHFGAAFAPESSALRRRRRLRRVRMAARSGGTRSVAALRRHARTPRAEGGSWTASWKNNLNRALLLDGGNCRRPLTDTAKTTAGGRCGHHVESPELHDRVLGLTDELKWMTDNPEEMLLDREPTQLSIGVIVHRLGHIQATMRTRSQQEGEVRKVDSSHVELLDIVSLDKRGVTESSEDNCRPRRCGEGLECEDGHAGTALSSPVNIAGVEFASVSGSRMKDKGRSKFQRSVNGNGMQCMLRAQVSHTHQVDF